MKKIFLLCPVFFIIGLIVSCSRISKEEIRQKEVEKVQVYRHNEDLFSVRSSWSEKEDLIIQFYRFANERAILVPKNTPFAAVLKKGKVIRASGDDYVATAPLGAYRTLSGNHGSPFTRTLTIPAHGMSVKDLGSVIKGHRNRNYIIMQIVDKNRIMIHPEGVKNTLNPGFVAHNLSEKLFYKGKLLPVKESRFTQLYPLNRVTDLRLLADGKTPVPLKTAVPCKFVDFHFTHDVIDPYMAVQSVKNNPGREPSPRWQGVWKMQTVNTPALQKQYASYMKLPALATYQNKFRFEAGGACVNYRKATFHVDLARVCALEVMAGWSGVMCNQKEQLFYIPKLKTVKVPPYRGQPAQELDFRKGISVAVRKPINYRIPRKDCLDRNNLPDRFIRVTGDGKERKYGFVLGYSLFMGYTGLPADQQMRDPVYFLWHTRKMYPYAYNFPKVSAGKVVEVVAYKQYFNPQKEKDATSFYCHHQQNSFMVYLDFHKNLKNKAIQLPPGQEGKTIMILEKTPTVTLHTQKRVPADGVITLDVKDQYGYLVLKLD